MNPWQRWRVQVPLILPIFFSWLAVGGVGIAIATIRAKFGAGGLGVLLFDGIPKQVVMTKSGQIAVAILAFVINGALLARWASNPARRIGIVKLSQG